MICDLLISDGFPGVRFVVVVSLVALQSGFDRMSDGCVMVFCEETQDRSVCFGLVDAKTG